MNRLAYATWPDHAPEFVDIAAMNHEAEQERKAAIEAHIAAHPIEACRVLTRPGDLCSVCWTDHDGEATKTTTDERRTA